QLPAPVSQLTQVALQQGMWIQPDAVSVSDAMYRIALEKRTKLVDSSPVEPLELSEDSQLGVKCIERVLLLLPRVDQHRNAMAERHLAERPGRVVEEGPARQRERPHQPVSERIVQHGRAAP